MQLVPSTIAGLLHDVIPWNIHSPEALENYSFKKNEKAEHPVCLH